MYLSLETALWTCVTIVTTTSGQVAGNQCSSPWVQFRESCYIFATGYPEDWTEAGVCTCYYDIYLTMAERVISSLKVKCMLGGGGFSMPLWPSLTHPSTSERISIISSIGKSGERGGVRSSVLIFKKSLISIAIGIYKRNVKYAMRASTNQTN